MNFASLLSQEYDPLEQWPNSDNTERGRAMWYTFYLVGDSIKVFIIRFLSSRSIHQINKLARVAGLDSREEAVQTITFVDDLSASDFKLIEMPNELLNLMTENGRYDLIFCILSPYNDIFLYSPCMKTARFFTIYRSSR